MSTSVGQTITTEEIIHAGSAKAACLQVAIWSLVIAVALVVVIIVILVTLPPKENSVLQLPGSVKDALSKNTKSTGMLAAPNARRQTWPSWQPDSAYVAGDCAPSCKKTLEGAQLCCKGCKDDYANVGSKCCPIVPPCPIKKQVVTTPCGCGPVVVSQSPSCNNKCCPDVAAQCPVVIKEQQKPKVVVVTTDNACNRQQIPASVSKLLHPAGYASDASQGPVVVMHAQGAQQEHTNNNRGPKSILRGAAFPSELKKKLKPMGDVDVLTLLKQQ